MKIEYKRFKLHSKCAKCTHYYPIDQDGIMLDVHAYNIERMEVKMRMRNGKIKKVTFDKLVLKPKKKNLYRKPVASCCGLNIYILEEQDYPFMKCPPCYHEREEK